MLFHDDELGHTIIGEAALSLALGDKDISVETLIEQLSLIAENETSDARLVQITDARNWLKSFRQPGQKYPSAWHWLTEAGSEGEISLSGDVVRFRPDNDDER
ncbi:hypothetical protein NG99_05775 [Erwinia typographi]|uniref:Uncharacterized protein n=1 Tax=Erwinia typographi TaxID=371042 RepID=A0A0A4ABC3_9GAMM|nr:hypothetical protein [Erwinia typographi]KGT95133.1 hypothetical protein NG99_05775 [Erwinia typographi]